MFQVMEQRESREDVAKEWRGRVMWPKGHMRKVIIEL